MRNYSQRLNHLIPGGAHTYSRGIDQYPQNAPAILSHGKGCYVWDHRGKKYLDYGMALRAVTIGYAYKAIADAAVIQIRKGNNLTRPSLIELEAAEKITNLIPCADMVKFAKNGSTITTAAGKLARAYTNRKYVAICLDHSFFSYDDWFIGSKEMDRGIPEEYKQLTIKFRYNDIGSLERLFHSYPNQIAAVIMEPMVSDEPQLGYLAEVKHLCKKHGTVFILDEMITGFRWHLQGAQKYFNVTPDLATFGKAMGNGFSVAALVGKREIMELGGILKEGAERVFLISTTHGAEMCGLGAFVKTLDIYKKYNVVQHLWDYGKKLKEGVNSIAGSLGISDHFIIKGYPCSPEYCAKDQDGNSSFAFKTLFAQEMLKQKVLMPWIALSYSHGAKELAMTLDAAAKALNIYSKALHYGIDKYLKGKPVKPVFRKWN